MAAARCFLRSNLLGNVRSQLRISRAICSQITKYKGSFLPMWEDPHVQESLRRIRGLQLGKVYKFRQQHEPETPRYKLLTDQEVLEVQQEAERQAEEYLKMPPQMTKRREINEVINVDKEYVGFEESKYVFTDISSSTTDESRRIVVREPNGTLRQARWEERDRMNLTYHPKDGKKFYMPPMLQKEHSQTVFKQSRHEDILDLACVQCEPDSSDYIEIHERTYQDIIRQKKYDVLRSTRHFGGFIFHLITKRRINGLLEHMLEHNRVNDAIELVELNNYVSKQAPTSQAAKTLNLKGAELLKAHLKLHNLSRGLYLFDNLDNNQSNQTEASQLE